MTVTSIVITPQVDDDWREQAACKSSDPDAWFPEASSSANAALRICRTCPVMGRCAAEAIARGEQHGCWGGMSEAALRRAVRVDRALRGESKHDDDQETAA